MGSVEDGALWDKQYEAAIRNEVVESEYCGQDLANTTLTHIKDMGIKKVGLRNAVFRAIQDLVKGPKEHQAIGRECG